MDRKVLNSMFENLLHIGNKKNYWSPKMKDYIYGSVNGIHVINLLETAKRIEEVKAELGALHADGKKILFVATKLQARDAFSKLAIETGHFYVTEKWVPGLLTNFKTIKKRISTYLKLLKDAESGVFDVLTKKEKAGKMLELEKLDRAYKGLKEIKKVPDVIFAVDGIFELQSIREANSLNLPCFAIFNTNGDDSLVTNLVPANTNSVKSIEYIANELSTTLKTVKSKSGFTKAPAKKVSGEKTAPVKKTVAKTETPVKAETPVKKEAPVKTEAPVKKEETAKKEAPAKKPAAKKAPAKKVEEKTEVKTETK